jgi:hypothetical protein
MDLHSESLNVVGAVRTSGEVGQVELDLIPAIIQPHRHCADERLDTRHRLVIGCSEPTSDVLIIQDLHFKREVFLHVLDDHDQERQLDTESLLWVCRARNVRGAHVCGSNVNDKRLDVLVGDPFDVTIADLEYRKK